MTITDIVASLTGGDAATWQRAPEVIRRGPFAAGEPTSSPPALSR
jgi:hypothetical protein